MSGRRTGLSERGGAEHWRESCTAPTWHVSCLRARQQTVPHSASSCIFAFCPTWASIWALLWLPIAVVHVLGHAYWACAVWQASSR